MHVAICWREIKLSMAMWSVSGTCSHLQDYMYEVLDRDTMPGGRSIWIIDMKGEHYLIA